MHFNSSKYYVRKKWRSVVFFQAHKLEHRIHDIDLEALNVKTVSEVYVNERFINY